MHIVTFFFFSLSLFNNSLQVLFTQTEKKKIPSCSRVLFFFFFSCNSISRFHNPSIYLARSSQTTSLNNKKRKHAVSPKLRQRTVQSGFAQSAPKRTLLLSEINGRRGGGRERRHKEENNNDTAMTKRSKSFRKCISVALRTHKKRY